MKRLYLLTGASGHLGSTICKKLLERKEEVRVFVLPKEVDRIPEDVEIIKGDIRDKKSLLPFFNRDGYEEVILIHAAAKISILSKEDDSLEQINLYGTKNIMELSLEKHIERVIYVSSVHAIKEEEAPQIIKETEMFSKNLVNGQYAKSKAEAAKHVLEYAKKGLNVSIVHPTGIIGPGDALRNNHMIQTMNYMAKGWIPFGVEGGYDFVDVRDVADGILQCAEKGKKGECYILSGHYLSIKEICNIIREEKGKRKVNFVLAVGLAKMIAPLAESISILFHIKPILTPYSIHVLNTNAHFSHEKAKKEWGYQVRDYRVSIRESLD